MSQYPRRLGIRDAAVRDLGSLHIQLLDAIDMYQKRLCLAVWCHFDDSVADELGHVTDLIQMSVELPVDVVSPESNDIAYS